jgi:hypothetical protein
MRIRTGRFARLLSVLLGAALTAVTAPAFAAARPPLTVTGEPTPAERSLIEDVWDDFTDAFAPLGGCLAAVEVKVVDRAEDWYGGDDVGPIAAFYRFPPSSMVFVEHGKVNASNLLHELAHHLDVHCGLGAGPVGEEFKAAQGIPEKRDWLSGNAWSKVPAEAFAEAVAAHFGAGVSIRVTAEALEVVASLTRYPSIDPDLARVQSALAEMGKDPADPPAAEQRTTRVSPPARWAVAAPTRRAVAAPTQRVVAAPTRVRLLTPRVPRIPPAVLAGLEAVAATMLSGVVHQR